MHVYVYAFILFMQCLIVNIIVHCHIYYNIIGMLYFQLANIDPAFRSKLESINLVAIFRCNLLEHYSIDAILTPFVQDLKKLENV